MAGEIVLELLLESRVPGVIHQPPADQMLAQPVDGVFLLPGLDLGVAPVAGRVVARRVRADAIRDGLDERRPLPLARALEGIAQDLAHREEIVAVHAHARGRRTPALSPRGSATPSAATWER